MTSVSADRPGAWEEPGEEELSRLEALAEKATPGPWHFFQNRHPTSQGAPWGTVESKRHPALGAGTPLIRKLHWEGDKERRDARFIAATDPDTVRSLIASLRSARAERDEALARIAAVEALPDVGFAHMREGFVEGYNRALRDVRAALGAATPDRKDETR